MKRFLPLLAIFFVMHALADTPPPGTVKAKMFSGDGNTSITATSGAIDVNVKNTGGLTTVNQGSAGVAAWLASITSSVLPTNACQETGGNLAAINTKLNGSIAVTGNFYQATQPVSGTFWQATQPVSGTLTCNAGSGTQAVSLAALPTGSNTIGAVNINGTVPISGTITATNSANGNTGSAVPAQATQVAGSDGTSLRALKVSATGVVSVDGSAVTQPVSASSLPLPTGAATSALQTTGNTSLSSIDTKTAALVSGRVPVDGSAVTQPVSAASLPLPTGASTSALQTTGNGSLSSIDSKVPALGQALAAGSVPVVLTASQLSTLTPLSTVSVSNFPATQPVSGSVSVSNFPATQAVSAASLPLPTGAATAANQATEITSLGTIATNSGTQATAANQATEISSLGTISSTLTSIDAGTAASLGQTTMSASVPVTISSDQSAVQISQPDLFVTGQSAQTALINNIIPTSASANATDVSGYRSGSIQVVSTGTAGGFILEGSNDNVNFQTTPMYNQAVVTGTPITAAVTPTVSQIIYSFPIKTKYIRLRISTAVTGGSIQAFSRFSQESWSPAVMTAVNGTAANLQTTATIASGTVTTVSTVSSMTSGNLGIPGIIADVASAALTTTTTTATLTPTFGVGYVVSIPVTVVTGTTPTLDVQVQESGDTGTNWTTVYTFPTITTTGYFTSPPLYLKGNRVRYVQTVAGTTPSFTRAINRLQMSQAAPAPVNNNATFASAAVSGVTTLVAPANAIGFVLQNLNTNTTNLRYAIGAAASSSSGMQLEPGRDTGEIHSGKSISICPESGTITYSLQWVQQ